MTSTHSQFATDEVESATDYEKAQLGVRLLLEAVGEDPDSDALAEIRQRRVPGVFEILTEGQRQATKLTRYVRWQSRQLTMQEQLTNDIVSGLEAKLDAATVFVEMNAAHLCEAMRGVETESTTTTRVTVGKPTEAERERFQEAVDRTEGQ